MAYLYNAYEGSLADLERRLQPVDEDDKLEQLDVATAETWTQVTNDLLSEIDWHELEDVVALADRRIPQTAALLHGLFVDPPLEIHPDGFGWSGCLTADERRALVDSLAHVLNPEQVRFVAERHHRDTRPAAEQDPADLSLIYVYLTLDSVAEDHDVSVYLG